jgi:hypothetical protein
MERARSLAGDYGLNGTERLCLPMKSPLERTGSIVGGESIPWRFPGFNTDMRVKGGDNEKNI